VTWPKIAKKAGGLTGANKYGKPIAPGRNTFVREKGTKREGKMHLCGFGLKMKISSQNDTLAGKEKKSLGGPRRI